MILIERGDAPMDENKTGEQEKRRNRRSRRAAATAVAAVTAGGVVMGGLFSSPEDLMNGDDGDDAPVPVVESAVPDAGGADGGDAEDEDAGDSEDEERRRGGLRNRARQWIWQLPAAVRGLVGVPLWALGWLIITGASALWGGVLSPVFATVLGWVLTAAVLLGAFALTARAIFPDLPLKKILNRRSFLGLLIGTAVLALAEAVVPLFWDGYGKIAQLIRALGSAGILGLMTALFARRENRRRQKEAAKREREKAEAEPEPETMEDALRRARELADSVCPRVY